MSPYGEYHNHVMAAMIVVFIGMDCTMGALIYAGLPASDKQLGWIAAACWFVVVVSFKACNLHAIYLGCGVGMARVCHSRQRLIRPATWPARPSTSGTRLL